MVGRPQPGPKPGRGARPRPHDVPAFGLGLRFSKPKMDKAEPKPRHPGQAES
jgi:hypothetical protein